MLKFGTDGIRAKGTLFDEPFICRFSKAICKVFGKISVYIGRDTRVSGGEIENMLTAHLLSNGISVFRGGVMPTPTLAFLTKSSGCQLGIMISASHNPPEYNGLKLFSGQGAKIATQLEKEIESALNQDFKPNFGAQGIVYNGEVENYITYLEGIFGNSLIGMELATDLCHGATFSIVSKVFERLGIRLKDINADDNGECINVKCGATCLTPLQEYCLKENCSLGFAFDGDGDRVIAIKDGKMLTGDDILYLITRYFELKGRLATRCVVGTLMSNMGLEKSLEDRGISFVRADVGDKYVYQKMLESGSEIGGEDSGHIILRHYSQTGDGLLTALFVALIDREVGINRLLDMVKYPCVESDITASVEQKELLQGSTKIKEFLELYEKENAVRVVARPSGTEPKIRIMVEGETYEKAKESAIKIKEFISTEIVQNMELKNTKTNNKVSQNPINAKEDYQKYTNNGVTIVEPSTTFIAKGVEIGKGSIIYPFNYIAGKTIIGENANIYSFCDITDTTIGDGVDIRSSYCLNANIGAHSTIGPFATLRKGANIGKGCRIGDYVEVKNSVIGDGVKAAHLTYVGDADVGAHTNVGCGTVFANYNGKLKRRTEVGERVFIGCNSNLIAPLKIGNDCYIAGGSTITEDIPSGKFSIARPTQKTVDKRQK